MTPKPTIRQLEKRVVEAAMAEWEYEGRPIYEAGYHSTTRWYWFAAEANKLEKERKNACAALAKARKK